MGSEWDECQFGDLCTHSAFGPRFSSKEYSDSGNIACLRTKDIDTGGRIGFETMPLADLDKASFSSHFLKRDDLVVTRTGRVGTTAVFTEFELPVVPGAFLIRFRLDQERACPWFFRYFFNSEIGQDLIQTIATGSVQQNINTTNFRKLPVPLPPLTEQKAIAYILGTLDEKIELNRRMNATLEGMAQALFKSWFVDFDPVIDNALAAGNPIPDELAARAEVRRQALAQQGSVDHPNPSDPKSLFPTAFEFTEELGWIPESWEVSKIGDECETVGGGTPSTKNPDFWDGGRYPWVTPKNFSALQDKVLLSSSRFLTKEGLNKVSSGLLPIGTVLMSSRAPVGYLAISQIETAINQGFIAMICNGKLSPEYVLQWANSRMDDIKQTSSGSTFAEISKKAFRPFRVIVPTDNALKSYTNSVGSIYQRITSNLAESATLSSLRDALLPQLISGELRVDA